MGVGGAGGYFAQRWVEAGKDVIALARGRHLKAIQQNGLTVLSPLGTSTVPVRATSEPAALGDADLVVSATKTWQLPAAVSEVGPFLGSQALVMGLQNGVGSVEVLSEAAHPDRVLGGTCRILSYLEGPGVVRHLGVQPTITFGEPRGGMSARVDEVAQALAVNGKVSAEPSADIRRELWQKFLFFSAVSGMSSVRRVTIGRLRSDPETRALLKSAIREAAAVGRAQGVGLEEGAEEKAMTFLDGVPGDGTSSMQRDFDAGRRTELEALSGYLSRSGGELGIPTPTHDFIYDTLVPLERQARARADS